MTLVTYFADIPIELSLLINEFLQGQLYCELLLREKMASFQQALDDMNTFTKRLRDDFNKAKNKAYNTQRNFINQYLPLINNQIDVTFESPIQFDSIANYSDISHQVVQWSRLVQDLQQINEEAVLALGQVPAKQPAFSALLLGLIQHAIRTKDTDTAKQSLLNAR